MNKETLINDLDNMEKIMFRTVDRCDLWQDRLIYWMAVAIYHILLQIAKDKGWTKPTKPAKQDPVDEIQITITDLAEQDPGLIKRY